MQGNGLWHVSLAQQDLIEQAGLNKKDFEDNFTHFNYKNRKVIISHIFKEHLVVSVSCKEDEDIKNLMDGFSKVVEYKPFCKYLLMIPNGNETTPLPTYEWDKINPSSRYEVLSSKKNISNLVRL